MNMKPTNFFNKYSSHYSCDTVYKVIIELG